MKKVRLILILATLLFGFSSIAKENGGHGGDALLVGPTKVVWDAVEYGNPFDPSESTLAFQIILEQLGKLRKNLPLLAGYLESFFYENRPLWWLVIPNLIDLPDGETKLIINYKSQQAAINSEGLIQINQIIWDELDSRSKAYLIFHEVLWTALNYEVDDPTVIRKLTGIFLNPYIDSMSPNNLFEVITKNFNWYAEPYKEYGNFRRRLSKDLGFDLIRFDGRPITKPMSKCRIFEVGPLCSSDSPRSKYEYRLRGLTPNGWEDIQWVRISCNQPEMSYAKNAFQKSLEALKKSGRCEDSSLSISRPKFRDYERGFLDFGQ